MKNFNSNKHGFLKCNKARSLTRTSLYFSCKLFSQSIYFAS